MNKSSQTHPGSCGKANIISSLILTIHTVSLLFFLSSGKYPDLFDCILFFANFAACLMLLKGYFTDSELTLSSMFLILAHYLIGRTIAPDDLTSGAALVVNIFVIYSALNIYRYEKPSLWCLFVISYLLLFLIFIVFQKNAEPLFLCAAFALSGVGRHKRLLAFFWAIVIAFTFCQPYAWEALIIFFVALKIFFSFKSFDGSHLIKIFLILGLSALFVLIFPLISVVLNEDPRNIFRALAEKRFIDSVYTSFISALASTVFLIIFFTPFAYAVSRSEFKFKNFIISLSDISIIVPESIAGMALLLIYGSRQPVGELLNSLLSLKFDGAFLGIAMCQVFASMPFYFRAALRAFESVPRDLEFTAETLGASRLQAIIKIALPNAAQGLFHASVLAFGRSAALFGAVLLVAPNPETAPILAFNRFQSLGIHETTPLVAAMLIIFFLLFLLLQTIASEKIS